MNIYRISISIEDAHSVSVAVDRNDGVYLQLGEDGRRIVDELMRTMTDAATKLLGSSITDVRDARPPVDDTWDAVIDEGVDHI